MQMYRRAQAYTGRQHARSSSLDAWNLRRACMGHIQDKPLTKVHTQCKTEREGDMAHVLFAMAEL